MSVNYFKEIKKNFDEFQELTEIFTSYLNKETDLKESARYTYHTEDVESFDDEVDKIEVDFLLNLYLQDNLIDRYGLVSETLRNLGFCDVKLIDTVYEEESGCYNTAFTFYKIYDRRK